VQPGSVARALQTKEQPLNLSHQELGVGLLHVVLRAQRDGDAPLRLEIMPAGPNQHGDICRARFRLELREDIAPVCIGKADIEHDQIWLRLERRGQDGRTASNLRELVTEFGRHPLHHAVYRRVIVREQDPAATRHRATIQAVDAGRPTCVLKAHSGGAARAADSDLELDEKGQKHGFCGEAPDPPVLDSLPPMKETLLRFGVAMESSLVEQLDALAAERGCNRSELLRDLTRAEVSRTVLAEKVPAFAAVTLVYNHHVRELSERLTALQHDLGEQVRSTLHVHLDREHCLEVIVMRGRSDQLKEVTGRMIGTRGVLQGGAEYVAESSLRAGGAGHRDHQHDGLEAHSHAKAHAPREIPTHTKRRASPAGAKADGAAEAKAERAKARKIRR